MTSPRSDLELSPTKGANDSITLSFPPIGGLVVKKPPHEGPFDGAAGHVGLLSHSSHIIKGSRLYFVQLAEA